MGMACRGRFGTGPGGGGVGMSHYQAAARYLEKIIRNYPDAPEAEEAQKLRDEIEDEL